MDQDKDIAVLEVREPPPMPAAAEGDGDDAAALVGADAGRSGLLKFWSQLLLQVASFSAGISIFALQQQSRHTSP